MQKKWEIKENRNTEHLVPLVSTAQMQMMLHALLGLNKSQSVFST